MTPVILLGGMTVGIFTPTEGAIIASAYALALGLIWYRTLDVKMLVKISMDTIETTATVLLIVAAASIFGWLLTVTRVTDAVAAWVLAFTHTPWVFLLLANVLMLVVGCFLEPVAAITLLVPIDQAFPAGLPEDPRLERLAGDISVPGFAARAIAADTTSIFHLAAVVSGAAEADFDLGMRVNLGGMRAVLDQARKCVHPPRLVFASSVAAFGGDLPKVLDDSTTPAPQTSYGVQKVISEYLVSDFSRKGYIDGRSLRLPTIVVRPGKANAAASSFASAVVREP